MAAKSPQQSAEWIEKLALEFMSGPANDIRMPGGPEPAFGAPLFGCAAGDDSIWPTFKATVDPGHWTPAEAFHLAYPNEKDVAPEDLSVISWILPQTEATLRDQRAATDFPSERWIRNRFLAQPRVNDGLAMFLLEKLQAEGIQALAPDFLPKWEIVDSERFFISSYWSHRHAAFAAGLGTFGLSEGLITKAGMAMRTGSLVVRLKLPAGERPYSRPYEYCLFHNSGTCGKCIRRCPCGAISPEGHDKKKCRAFLYEAVQANLAGHWPDLAGGYGCGLCQAAVPCERRVPPRPKKAGT